MLKEDLTVKPFCAMDLVGEPPSFQLFSETDTEIVIPKSFGLKHFGAPDTMCIPTPGELHLPFQGSLRSEQLAPINAFLDAAHDLERMGGIINLACGQGKTVCALYILSQLRCKALIVVHKEFLLNQWKERISAFLPTARVGLFKGKTQDTIDKDIVIGTVQSLSMKTFDVCKMFPDIGFMCVDECHRTGAEVFCRMYQKLNVRYTLGLSATLERKDGLSNVFKWHIGDVVYKGKHGAEGVVVARMCAFRHEDRTYCREKTMYNGQVNISSMINALCGFEPRTTYTVNITMDLLAQDENRKVLVLSDRRNHLHKLHDMFTRHGVACGFYYGGMKDKDLKESETMQVLLATYAFCSEGLDVPKLDTLVLSSPKSDVVQACGRILREKPGDRVNIPVILDVVDDFSLFGAQSRKREKYYHKQGYKLEHC
jgi:superfamily II DNA or RNA helicase